MTQTHTPQEAYAELLYKGLDSLAEDEVVARKKVRVFRGAITTVYAQLGISQSHYKNVRQLLEHNGCIQELSRGRRGHPSVIVLHGLPKTEWKKPPKKDSARDLTRNPEFAKLSDRVQKLENMVGGLHLPTVLAELAAAIDGRKHGSQA